MNERFRWSTPVLPLLATFLALFPSSCGREPATAAEPSETLVAAPSQHLLVVTGAPGDIHGVLYRMERVPGSATGADSAPRRRLSSDPSSESDWRQVGEPIPVVVGRSGVGPKREGDGRSPRGVYQLGPAFGYAPEPPPGVRFPYQALAPGFVCVDDTASAHYTGIFDADTLSMEKDWTSAELMRRDLANGDDLYKWGIVVSYNDPPETALGSCIFVHIWRSSDTPTSGCTAMTEDHILEILRWLEPGDVPGSGPVLVQGDRRYLEELVASGVLPYPLPG